LGGPQFHEGSWGPFYSELFFGGGGGGPPVLIVREEK